MMHNLLPTNLFPLIYKPLILRFRIVRQLILRFLSDPIILRLIIWNLWRFLSYFNRAPTLKSTLTKMLMKYTSKDSDGDVPMPTWIFHK